MKYDKETTDRLLALYDGGNGSSVKNLSLEFSVPERSIRAKLASLGVYVKTPYVNKNGELPIKKEEYIERIADALDVNLELLESLEKCNKNVLKLLDQALRAEE